MKISIFDFDGTLVNTPTDTPDNRTLYEKATGLPWLINKELALELSKKLHRHVGIRRGWYGRPETLEPPLVPDPAPSEMFISEICNELAISKNDPETLTVVMTGRHAGLKKQVLRILSDGNLVSCQKKRDQSGNIWIESVDPKVSVYCLGQDGPCMQNAGTKPPDTLPWKLWVIKQFLRLHKDARIDIWEDREEHVYAFRDFLMHLGHAYEVHNVKEYLRR